MEIFLALIGLLVSKVDLLGTSKPQTLDMGAIGKQIIYYGGSSGIADDELKDYYFEGMNNITCEAFDFDIDGKDKDVIKNFVKKDYDKGKDKEDSKDHEMI